MAAKECPMCNELMHLQEVQITSRVPGTHQTKTTKNVEWVCTECDYLEDAEAEDIEGG
jgi:DNA-directed RNA polymerase subunit M/transcription elongation factor TFIIS